MTGEKDNIRKEIFLKLSTIENLPVMPQIAMDIMSYVDDEDTSIQKIADIISKDPALSAQVLKVSNSAFYSLRRNVGSLELAIILLGLREIKNIIFMMSVFRLFPRDSEFCFNEIDYLKHSILTGQTAQTLCGLFDLKFDSSPFLLGLLHDIGKIFIDQNFHEKYTRVIEQANKNEASIYEIEEERLGTNHAEIGAKIASGWNFPLEFVDCIRHHHDAQNSQENMLLASVIYMANLLTNARNIGLPSPSRGIDIAENPVWKIILGSDKKGKTLDIEKILFEIDDELKKSEEIISIYSKKLKY
jgi:putative nucleotidyltransferase with HDIG domain